MPTNKKKMLPRENSGEGFFPKGVMSVKEFLAWSGISRWKFYDEVKKKRLHPKKIGTRTGVPVPEAERWLEALPEFGSMPNSSVAEPE